MALSNTIHNLERHLEAIKADQPKVEKGVKRAARTVRKHFSSIAKLCKQGRIEALESTKSE
tara:strand:- start:8967 stop:9149 length:183 start_codon:yes stop_codon:yes gene_type:complete